MFTTNATTEGLTTQYSSATALHSPLHRPPPHIFNLKLAESADAEPMDKEGRLYFQSCSSPGAADKKLGDFGRNEISGSLAHVAFWKYKEPQSQKIQGWDPALTLTGGHRRPLWSSISLLKSRPAYFMGLT